MPQLSPNLLSTRLTGFIAGALLTAVFSTATVAQNTGSAESMERQQAQPLSLKIHKDYNLRTPRRGEAMDSVERRFGAPESVRGPVGEPPITRWEYQRFEVVFESDRVIHTVIEPDTDG
ncbi:hypothetical protein DES49_2367 [Halospina denitrificans]|uniref:Uncharacterized protein n=1 Tax=Halospina denitrificans TaxID=332522 RepID=A0A4R7JMZ4_9GAMM|nr:hypothetical protein [Halospina denitrificans]TDT39442.1 hypothetical protein DES49_2367 [Halospina denitrificans]